MKIAHGTLVMVADGAKLLLFRNEGDEKYAVLETLEHARQDNPATAEQGTDRPGRSFSRVGDKRSSYDETDWHQQSEDAFARHAAELLEETAQAHPEAGIVVIAAPRTLGEMRGHYGRATEQRLVAEIDKDLADHTTDDIVAALAAH
ncbi:host attachment family protein [Erythrobacter dokdonensis]|uniref:Host attachment protein n=1 Tax=Erythrobacter dokdonensis DSW-74 TaxID=1300349 RepID=A0A1A7BEN1_9SPHN|nr:host attachment family protein [Erythrobacter dokdonensis]OBV10998.1 Host attachment protein [Erythrobacter dokdonensis DSW-74]